jgi:molybdopterin-dependent oxidoreductase alpha subunit
MPDSSKSPIVAEPPLEERPAQIANVSRAAGGLPAILKSLEHAVGKMGSVNAARTLLRLNQKGGFDCQSCAWPDEDGHRDTAAFCENGAKAVADEAMGARINRDFFARHSVAELSRRSEHWLGQQGRLTEPMALREGATHYAPISWDEAFDLIARELNALASPDEAAFYTSGRTSNEAAFLYQLFVRQLGTNNLPDCSNMCHESSGAALTSSLGIGKGTVKLDDFDKAEVIFILGQNPGTNHPRMLTALQKAKRHGAFIISANPLPETGLQRFKHPQEVFDTLVGKGTALTDLFLQLRINGDMALLQGLMKDLLDREAAKPGTVLDRAFIDARTLGFEGLCAQLQQTRWEQIEAISGLTEAQIREAGGHLARAERIIACWAMGLTQHKNAVATIHDVVNLLLLRGAVGKPGAGVCPVRGHSNVQGDRTMGVWEKMPGWFHDALDREFSFASPRGHGLDTVETIKAMHTGAVKVFVGMGGNFVSATPDTAFTARALARCRLTAQVSTKLNRGHLVTGKVGLILPCLGRTEVDLQAAGEQVVTTENSMGVVQASRGNLAPASEALRSEVAIVAGLARATLGVKSTVDWEGLSADYRQIRAHISRVIPGFEEYEARANSPGGFYLPNGPREGRFTTPSGKAHFAAHPLSHPTLAPGQLLLMTIRSHDQFNTTIYGLDDRYRGIHGGRRVIFLNPEDVAERGLAAGKFVDLTGHRAGQQRHAPRFQVVPFSIPRGCAAAYFPETNVLVPVDSVADQSNTPASKSIVITLAESPAPTPGTLMLPEATLQR